MTLREMLLHVKDNHEVKIGFYWHPEIIFKGDVKDALADATVRKYGDHGVVEIYAEGSSLCIAVDMFEEDKKQ